MVNTLFYTPMVYNSINTAAFPVLCGFQFYNSGKSEPPALKMDILKSQLKLTKEETTGLLAADPFGLIVWGRTMRTERDAMSFAARTELININNPTMGVYYMRDWRIRRVYTMGVYYRVHTMGVYHCPPSPYFNAFRIADSKKS
jgi:hypothetical protein